MMPLPRCMAPGKWPRAHSLSSRTSTRIIFSRASRRRLISRKSASLDARFGVVRRSSEIRGSVSWCAPSSDLPERSTVVTRRYSDELRQGSAPSHVAPVRAGFHIDDQRNAQRVDLLHGGAHERAQAVEFLGRRFEQQFVVDLQDHAGAQASARRARAGWRSWPA